MGKKVKLTHDAARARVCKVCVKKKKCVRPCTTRYEALIAKHYKPGLDPQDDSLPTGICSVCSKALNNVESGKPGAGGHVLPPSDHFDYRYVLGHCLFKTSFKLNFGPFITVL